MVNTISGIRHANLLALIEAAGGVGPFSERVERSYSQISQLKNRSRHSTTGQPREIGDDIARHIEAKLQLPEGWMDHPHAELPPLEERGATVLRVAEPPAPFNVRRTSWPFPSVKEETYFALSPDDRARVENFVLALIQSASAATHPRAEGER